MKKLLLVIISWVCFAFPAVAESNWRTDGEILNYDIYWSFIKAGEAQLSYTPHENKKYTIQSRAWTTSGVKSFFTLKDLITVKGNHTIKRSFLPETYELKLVENDYRADKNVRYLHSNKEAIYTNVWGRQPPRGFPIEVQTRDMISALYFLRATKTNAKIGDVYSLPVFDLDKSYLMDVKIIGKETIEINGEEISTIHIQPILHGVSDKRTSDKWHIWVTNNADFIPVKIMVEMKVGGFKAVLNSRKIRDKKIPINPPKPVYNHLTGF